LTDNGGAKAMHADNTPLRGFKGSLTEGGIRTPFLVSWPAKFSGARTIDTPVISLDILPTVIDATSQLPKKNNFDGKSLLPLLTGDSQTHHDTLFWCKDGDEWAVRRGDWKLRSVKGQTELFNLGDDPSEQHNLVDDRTEIVKSLGSAFATWKAQMADPITGSGKRVEAEPTKKPLTDREKQRLKKRLERKKQRDAEKKAGKEDTREEKRLARRSLALVNNAVKDF